MGRIANYSNTHKYSNRQSFDGKPVEAGKVLVPFIKDTFNLKKSDYIQDNFTTMTLGEFTYELGFMPIPEEHFASYMKDFWNDINEDLKMRREGRCVLTNPDGTERLCPNTRRCKNCPHKGLLERRNPNRVDILSLDFEYEGESFDTEDTTTPSVEDQVLNALEPEPTVEEIKIQMLAHFEKVNQRYDEIIRLSAEGMSIDEICITIGLKSSRGRQVINDCHDAVCDYLKLYHHKKNRK